MTRYHGEPSKRSKAKLPNRNGREIKVTTDFAQKLASNCQRIDLIGQLIRRVHCACHCTAGLHANGELAEIVTPEKIAGEDLLTCQNERFCSRPADEISLQQCI